MTRKARNEGNTLVVTSAMQRMHLLEEMQGQLSDGQWENTRPYDHWEVWCDLEADDVIVGEDYGRNFYARKCNYQFASKDLLDCIGDRMVFKAKLCTLYPQVMDHLAAAGNVLPDSLADYESHLKHLLDAEHELEHITHRCLEHDDEDYIRNHDAWAANERWQRMQEVLEIPSREYDRRRDEMRKAVGDDDLADGYWSAHHSFGYYSQWLARMEAAGITPVMVQEAEASDCYTMSTLRADMKALKKAFKRDRRHDPLPEPRQGRRKAAKEASTQGIAAGDRDGLVHLRTFYRFECEAPPLRLLMTAATERFTRFTGVGDIANVDADVFRWTQHGTAQFTSVKLAEYLVGAGITIHLLSRKNGARWGVRLVGSSLVVDRAKSEPITDFVR